MHGGILFRVNGPFLPVGIIVARAATGGAPYILAITDHRIDHIIGQSAVELVEVVESPTGESRETAAEEAEASVLPSFEYQLKILVVDDDRFYREQAAKILSEQNHNVTTAEDGLKGLAACLKDPPDLVLSDVQMPRMDGWNFLRTIRARPSLSATRVIFQTTLGGEQERLKGYQLGVDDYLAKPYAPEELVLRVERLFQRNMQLSGDPSRKALRGDLEQVSLPTVLSMSTSVTRHRKARKTTGYPRITIRATSWYFAFTARPRDTSKRAGY